MSILGLHHITLVTTDAQRNVDFYTRVLGLRLVKKTVNFDDPGSYHLYYGNETGDPGTAITFFEWPDVQPGAHGIGGTHHFALAVADESGLLRWKRRLTDVGLKVDGVFDRQYFKSIYFRDPDGTIVEIATQGPGWTVDEAADAIGTTRLLPPAAMQHDTFGDGFTVQRDNDTIAAPTWPEPVTTITADMALMQGMHHITAIASDIERTHAFYHDLLGMRRVKMTANFDDPSSAHWYWGVGEGKPGTIVTYFERSAQNTRRARMGAGQTHHFALAVADEAAQLEWRDKLIRAGYGVSPVRDRTYFKSIYTNDPDGHIVELATVGPGFAIDEPVESLGTRLMLPPQYESSRSVIEGALTPLHAEWHAPE